MFLSFSQGHFLELSKVADLAAGVHEVVELDAQLCVSCVVRLRVRVLVGKGALPFVLRFSVD